MHRAQWHVPHGQPNKLALGPVLLRLARERLSVRTPKQCDDGFQMERLHTLFYLHGWILHLGSDPEPSATA
jgi:hypothetical protein